MTLSNYFKVSNEKDYRKYRKEAFKKYYVGQIVTKDVDPAYWLINYIAKKEKVTKEQRYWLSWLYGVTYCGATTYYIFRNFPNLQAINIKNFEKWHKKNWRKLVYGNDNKYNKGHLAEMLLAYKKKLNGRMQGEFFEDLLADTPEKSFKNVWEEITSWNKFGRYITYFYSETLHRCCNLPIMCNDMMWDKAWSPRYGICYMFNKEELCDEKDEQTLNKIQRNLDKIVKEIKLEYPDIPIDCWFLETSLCAFKGHFTRNRYLGYYLDRQQTSITKMEQNTSENFDVLWNWRKENVFHEFLGEYNGYIGVRNELKNAYMDKGIIIGLKVLENKGIIKK